MSTKFEIAQQRAEDGYYPVVRGSTGNVIALGPDRPDGQFDDTKDISPKISLKVRILHSIFPNPIEWQNTEMSDWLATNNRRVGRKRGRRTFKPKA